MSGSWNEAETCVINLPDDKQEVFAVYINYVYTGHLSIATETEKETLELDSLDLADYLGSEYLLLFRVFVLAEKLQDVDTKIPS